VLLNQQVSKFESVFRKVRSEQQCFSTGYTSCLTEHVPTHLTTVHKM